MAAAAAPLSHSHHTRNTSLQPPGEELPVGRAHAALKKEWPQLLTVLAPRQASRAPEVAASLASELQLAAVLWSSGGVVGGSPDGAGGGSPGGGGAVLPPPLEGVDVIVLDVAADLPLMYW